MYILKYGLCIYVQATACMCMRGLVLALQMTFMILSLQLYHPCRGVLDLYLHLCMQYICMVTCFHNCMHMLENANIYICICICLWYTPSPTVLPSHSASAFVHANGEACIC